MGSLFKGPQIQGGPSGGLVTASNRNARSAIRDVQPINLNAGGLSSKFKNGNLNITSSAQRQGLVQGLAGTSFQQADDLAGLRGQVAPGVSGLRTSRLQQNENARSAAIGNLRENLAQRRVAGSSFGNDALNRAELTFAQEADRIEAESFLQEIELTNSFINQEAQARTNAFSAGLNELNFQADLGQRLSAQASNTLAQSAQLQSQLAIHNSSLSTQVGLSQAELDAQAQAGAGALIGKVAGVALAPATGGASLALTGSPISITNNS